VDTVELSFLTKRLRDLCEHEVVAKRELGAGVAAALRRRVADLRAAMSIDEISAGKPHDLDASGQRLLGITLREGYRLVVDVNHSNPHLLESDVMDRSVVTRIKLLRIEKQP